MITGELRSQVDRIWDAFRSGGIADPLEVMEQIYLLFINRLDEQIAFIRQIIDYLTHNGTMDPGKLYGQPFTEHHPYGLGGLFPQEDAKSLLSIIRQINENALV